MPSLELAAQGEAEFWIEPRIELTSDGRSLASVKRLIEEHEHEIRAAWQEHFGS